MSPQRLRSVPRHRASGAVTLMVLALMLVLVAAAGLGVEAGRLYVNRAELQTAADACALAAAQRLNCSSTDSSCLIAAETAGIAAAALNQADLQQTAVAVAASNITFATALDGTYSGRTGGAANNARFARCNAGATGLAPRILGVVGMSASAVWAGATATLAPSQSACAVVPFGVCSTLLASAAVGSIITADPKNNPKWALIDLGGGKSAAATKAVLAGEPLVCNLGTRTTIDLAAGASLSAIRGAWNTRFGIETGGYSILADNLKADWTGYGYPTKTSAAWPRTSAPYYTSYKARSTALTPFVQADFSNSSVLTGADTIVNPSTLPASNVGRRRITAAVSANCSATDDKFDISTKTYPLVGLACFLLLAPMDNGGTAVMTMEYLGDATTASSPCGPYIGTPGTGTTGPAVSTLVQ